MVAPAPAGATGITTEGSRTVATREQLGRSQVAERLGLQPKTIDTYQRRQIMPPPDGKIGRSPWWYASTIDRWDRTRRKLPQAAD